LKSDALVEDGDERGKAWGANGGEPSVKFHEVEPLQTALDLADRALADL
jgi:hypothetical protein